MALDFDPYAILGLPIDATDAQIAQARRRLSREYHPDVNGAPDAAERFDEIQQAFELLSDPAARAEYDRTGEAAPPPRTFEPARHAPRGPGRPAPTVPIWAGSVLGLFILVTVCVLLVMSA